MSSAFKFRRNTSTCKVCVEAETYNCHLIYCVKYITGYFLSNKGERCAVNTTIVPNKTIRLCRLALMLLIHNILRSVTCYNSGKLNSLNIINFGCTLPHRWCTDERGYNLSLPFHVGDVLMKEAKPHIDVRVKPKLRVFIQDQIVQLLSLNKTLNKTQFKLRNPTCKVLVPFVWSSVLP